MDTKTQNPKTVTSASEICLLMYQHVLMKFRYMLDEAELKKSYTKNTGSFLPGIYDSYSLGLKKEATGYGLEATAGVLYKPVDKLRLGLTLRSGSTIKIEGTATVTVGGATALKTDYDQNYDYPYSIALGAAYNFTEKF